ncbi:unnamed protein product [Polarella glacialis]|uniref:Bifunctional lysine-specific demethylase and histidyl-hydroxylase n=1 Tax=Polarella glacialis TaxID=89957 RepID=A0A813I183_POLGL|nr:unnamed protein product [Polarella glacialis]
MISGVCSPWRLESGFVGIRKAWLIFLLLAAPGSAGPDILERFVEPTTRQDFFADIYEQRWEYFPHNHSLLPISLSQVSEWIAAHGDSKEEVVETLQHPVDARSFEPMKKRPKPLQRIQDAFLQGFSMVINSLHRWSEPGLRLAQELFNAADLPVDVYMYLTPPHSSSYGLHSDVMDAFMVQLQGSKRWKVCDLPQWMLEGDKFNGEPPPGAKCEEITLRGGDVLYLPFGTLHQASTDEELSMHLTVNIERQYYVWGSLLQGALHKLVDADLRVEMFQFSEDDSPTPLAKVIQQLARAVPKLQRVPGFSLTLPGGSSALWLTRPLCSLDEPEPSRGPEASPTAGYLEQLAGEFQLVVAEVAAAVDHQQQLGAKRLRIGQSQLTLSEALGLLQGPAAVDQALPWVLQLARFHSLMHFRAGAGDAADKLLPVPELFSSLAAARAHLGHDGISVLRQATARKLSDVASWSNNNNDNDNRSSAQLRFRRHPQLRAVLLREEAITQGQGLSTAIATLLLNSGENSLEIRQQELPAILFCLGLFGDSTSRGRSFLAEEVPGSSGSADNNNNHNNQASGKNLTMKLLQKLLAKGALQIVHPGLSEA